MKNLKCFVMLLCATLFFTSCKNDDETITSVTGVTINQSSLELTIGSSGILTAALNPEDATDKTVKWSSNKTDVATVDATGKVTAVEEGTAVITVTTADGGKTATCQVIVHPNRTIRFDEPGEGKVWGEEMGEIEVPLIFENGKLENFPITGKISVDNLVGCTKDDFTLETTEFTSTGNETQKIKIKVKNNDKFGEWSFRLVLTDVSMAVPIAKEFVVNIKDDERVLGFKSATYEVVEGDNVEINPFLYGGNAASRLPLSVEVVADQTTAHAQQYTLPTSFNAIYASTNSSSFTLRSFKHSSSEDKVLTLKITTTITNFGAGKLSYNETQYCKITIKNTDLPGEFE